VTDQNITVGSAELSGACFGDSGGPLLIRGDDGRAYTLGVLSTGTVSCIDSDSYVRLDPLAQWLIARGQLTDEPASPVPGEYERLGAEGRCFDERAVWFDAAGLHASVCSDDTACGWDRTVRGYRCVAATDDPCTGIDDVGRCEQGIARRCIGG